MSKHGDKIKGALAALKARADQSSKGQSGEAPLDMSKSKMPAPSVQPTLDNPTAEVVQDNAAVAGKRSLPGMRR